MTGNIYLLSLAFLTDRQSEDCCHIFPVGHPDSSSDMIEVIDCNGYKYFIAGAPAIINPTSACASEDCLGNFPPEAVNPTPSNEASNLPLNSILSWEFDDPFNQIHGSAVKFGTTTNPPFVTDMEYSYTYFDPGPLLPDTTYFWRIIMYYGYCNGRAGPLWSFHTTDTSPVEKTTWGAIKALYE